MISHLSISMVSHLSGAYAQVIYHTRKLLHNWGLCHVRSPRLARQNVEITARLIAIT